MSLDLQDDDGRFFIPADLDESHFEPSLFDLQHFRFPGPVSESFFHDNSFVSFIQGPYGSAKTTTAFFKLLRRAWAMPKCKDGIRRYRALVLRDTYRRMERTAIRSWHKWFPPSAGKWEGGQDRPSKHKLELENLEGEVLHFEIEFAAVGDLDIEDFMGGYEITDLFLNEVNLQKREVLTYGSGRCGRYPSMKDLPADTPLRGFPGYTLGRLPPGVEYKHLPPGTVFDYGVIGDLNAPEFDSWLLELRYGDLDPNLKKLGKKSFFLQPGGRSPNAENTQHLPPGYYEQLAAANAHQDWWVKRMIDNKPGYSRAGEPVYGAEYDDEIHVAKTVIPILPSVPLEFAFDGGGHPAAVVGQRTNAGQMRVLREFYFGRCGPTVFAEKVAEWLDGPAKGVPIARDHAMDPSAFDAKPDTERGETGIIEIIEDVTGLHLVRAPSNEPDIRLDAVRQELRYRIDGKEPALVLNSEGCSWLRKGFNSHYRYSKIRKEVGEEHSERPVKGEHSNPHDALQYLCLHSRGLQAVIRRKHGGKPREPHEQSSFSVSTGFSIFE